MLSPSPSSSSQSGFTLIELSIVLVIIGLIVGGVLVGQDLIKAAEVRATVSQIEKYNTAVNTFRGKYNGIPGDLNYSQASAFGMTTRSGATGRGDGNGLLESSAAGGTLPCAETVLFYTDLTTASLIDGSFVGADGAIGSTSCSPVIASAAALNTIVPVAKIGKGNNIFVYASLGINYFQLIGSISAVSNAGAITGAAVGLSPLEAYQMDLKVDDGFPLTGAVRAYNVVLAAATYPAADTGAAAAVGVCANTGGTNTPYNVSPATGGNANACSLRFKLN